VEKGAAAIGKALDGKIAGIRAQLDEAAQLRREAEQIKAEYEAKAAASEGEAAAMLERARHEAEAIRAKAETDAAALVERRTRMAETRSPPRSAPLCPPSARRPPTLPPGPRPRSSRNVMTAPATRP
jgi:hypothetical protein